MNYTNPLLPPSDCEALQEEVRELLLEKDENQHVIRLLETQKSILEEKVRESVCVCVVFVCLFVPPIWLENKEWTEPIAVINMLHKVSLLFHYHYIPECSLSQWNGGKDLDAAQAECVELREDVKACRYVCCRGIITMTTRYHDNLLLRQLLIKYDTQYVPM